jgi:hypothetical protein
MTFIFRIVVAINERLNFKPLGISKLSKRSKGTVDINALQYLNSQLYPGCVYNTLHTAEEEPLNVLGRAFSKLHIAPESSG